MNGIRSWRDRSQIQSWQYVSVVLKELFFCYFIIMVFFPSLLYFQKNHSLAIQSHKNDTSVRQRSCVFADPLLYCSDVQMTSAAQMPDYFALIQIRHCGIANHFPMFIRAISLYYCLFFGWFLDLVPLLYIVALISVVKSHENKNQLKCIWPGNFSFIFDSCLIFVIRIRDFQHDRPLLGCKNS